MLRQMFRNEGDSRDCMNVAYMDESKRAVRDAFAK